jgi:hypothetical protein
LAQSIAPNARVRPQKEGCKKGHGRGGEIATNRRDDQELAMLSLHLLQNCLVHINALMVQQVLAQPAWADELTAEDRRALTPLFYTHVNPYGSFELDMATRLPLDQPL